MEKNIEFYSDGSKIKGILYLPDDPGENEKIPGIVLCHGFAGVKELLLPPYAQAFSENGFAALVFDYRGFGESEGERGKLAPYFQVTDIRSALTFMQTQPQVDPDKLALWGTSFGGANAIVASAVDKRIKCLSVQLTFGDGERVITGGLDEQEKEKLLTMLHKLQVKGVTQNKSMQVTVQKILTDEQSIEFFNKTVETYPELNIKIPFLTIKETLEHKPEKHLGEVRVPILIVGAENDKVNPPEESGIIYEKANEPKELMMVPGATHYEVYEGERFNSVVGKQLEWFKTYLV